MEQLKLLEETRAETWALNPDQIRRKDPKTRPITPDGKVVTKKDEAKKLTPDGKVVTP